MTATKRLIGDLTEIASAVPYLRRISAEPRSLRTAVVKEMRGVYWRDLAVIKFSRDGTVTAPIAYAPTDNEQNAIKAEFDLVEFSKLQPITNLVSTSLPLQIQEAKPEALFEFRDEENKIVMVQVRVDGKGGKNYLPWTYWSDAQWRQMEPDGALPIWGMEAIGDNTTVFIHEGAKAARHVRDMVEGRTPAAKKRLADHPWGQELSGAAHVGWTGGALSPLRTDWAALRRLGIARAYVVTDNDNAGVSAVPPISRQLGMQTFHVQFTEEWPTSFDLADNFPKKMFADIGTERTYIGPAFRECLHPATWATDMVPPPSGKGKPIPILRDVFKDMWAYVEEADMFVCVEMPEIMRTEAVLNKMLAPFSHVSETSRLIVKTFRGRTTRLCYRPDVLGKIVTDRGSSAINLHVPTNIRMIDGDPTPWITYLKYLFPDDAERLTIMRWCATLIARPQIRMHFGLLLVTEKQGIGKTTLGSAVLQPLVGSSNVGWPSESDVSQSQFNSWLANKRLIFVNEIYSGHSWKAYHALKGMITDTELEVNQKYQKTYTVENWAHICACSNSIRAMRIEQDDRRWFYPRMTEIAWTRLQFSDFRKWLASGGLQIIKSWADKFGDYVNSGERSPTTKRKQDLIHSSRTEGSSEAAALGEALRDIGKPCSISMKDIVAHVRASVQGKVYESDQELRQAMTEVGGIHTYPERVKIGSRLQHIIINDDAQRIIERIEDDAGRQKVIRDMLLKTSDIMEPPI